MEVAGEFVIPGDKLGSAAEAVAGSGVCERDGHLVACIMGNVVSQELDGTHIVSVRPAAVSAVSGVHAMRWPCAIGAVA
jgi:exosome complex RNA-binding protein Csl4